MPVHETSLFIWRVAPGNAIFSACADQGESEGPILFIQLIKTLETNFYAL